MTPGKVLLLTFALLPKGALAQTQPAAATHTFQAQPSSTNWMDQPVSFGSTVLATVLLGAGITSLALWAAISSNNDEKKRRVSGPTAP